MRLSDRPEKEMSFSAGVAIKVELTSLDVCYYEQRACVVVQLLMIPRSHTCPFTSTCTHTLGPQRVGMLNLLFLQAQ